MTGDLLRHEPGRTFGFTDLVTWHDKPRPFTDVAASIDTVILGPHASATFPAEFAPFVDPSLDLRRQCDFSDCLTSPLGRLWARADPSVVFVENPFSRLVSDPNRPPPDDPIAGLRQCFERIAQAEAGTLPSLAGVDAIRPITFSGAPVLREPRSEQQWTELTDILRDCIARGPAAYAAITAEVIDQVLAARPSRPVLVISLHDTMNALMRPDGAIADMRSPSDLLPTWVNFGNRGDTTGNPTGDMPVSLAAPQANRLLRSWQTALRANLADFTLNRPYKGAYETQLWGERLTPRGARSGAIQVEFRREALLTPEAAAHLAEPGSDWPAPDMFHLGRIAVALATAGGAYRASLD